MRLVRVEVEGYRSIRDPLVLHFDPKVTVVVGANDHGKSNLLRALTHLNPEESFGPNDLNWDDEDAGLGADRPRVSAVFSLTPQERRRLKELEEESRSPPPDAPEAPSAGAATPAPAVGSGRTAPEPAAPPAASEKPKPVRLQDIPDEITLLRVGVSGSVAPAALEGVSSSGMATFLAESRPRIELIEMTAELGDSTTLEALQAGSEFMRGIFYYAGLDQDSWNGVFTQNPRTERRLDEASEKLNENLTASWAQGKDLKFLLRHNSSTSEIELKIEDPAVSGRYVHASQRSAGFTHFFKLRTILHAREVEASAQSYVWLFDEPGVNLHPDGQRDLLKAFERIANTNQIGYCTHSIFLINSNFPARHRLLVKNSQGTRVDEKPYLGNWRSAIEALGLALPGTILFASQVLLTEGDSEPIYVPAVLQRLIEWGLWNGDLNPLSVMGTGDAVHADALTRWLSETTIRPAIAYLGDGDEGGQERLDSLKQLFDEKSVKAQLLADGMSVEDTLLWPEELWLPALAQYASKVATTESKKEKDPAAILAKLKSAFKTKYPTGETTDLGGWGAAEAARLVGRTKPLSKVGIAREYVTQLSTHAPATKPAKKDIPRTMALAGIVGKLLPVVGREAPAGEIVAGLGEAR